MNKENYKISVLVTFFNQEVYVDQALGSVMNQKTDIPYKVIVGDDGSTDGTVEKVEEWIRRYPDQIKLLIQPREKGREYIAGCRASKNRISLLNCVDTPYFIYLDGDDYWTDENKLSIQYNILEKEENADCIACAHQIQMYNEEHPSVIENIPKFTLKEKKFSLKKYWTSYYFHTDTILFRSKVISSLPWALLEDSFNDNLITFCFLQFGKIYYLPRCMAAYRQNSNGIWAGEKLITNIFRNLISYDLELQICARVERRIRIRHLVDFMAIVKNRNGFREITKPYRKLAKQYGCETAISLIQNGYIFHKNIIWENIYIFCLFICSKLMNLKTLNDIDFHK